MIDNPAAVRFCNERVRGVADTLGHAYKQAKIVLAYWGAKGVDGHFIAAPDQLVADGSQVDGRTPVTGGDVQALVALCAELVAAYEADGNAKLNRVLKVAVNPE